MLGLLSIFLFNFFLHAFCNSTKTSANSSVRRNRIFGLANCFNWDWSGPSVSGAWRVERGSTVWPWRFAGGVQGDGGGGSWGGWVDWWENNLERVGQKSEEVASCGGGSYAPFISNDMKWVGEALETLGRWREVDCKIAFQNWIQNQ